jgi:hypothetical protein
VASIFDIAHARRRVDELLIECPAVLAQCFDLQSELGLTVGRLALLRADRVEFLIVLLECITGCRRIRRR